MTLTEKEDRARSILRAIQSGQPRPLIADDHYVSESVVKALAVGSSFPHIYTEITGKNPKKRSRESRMQTPDEIIMQCHQMAHAGFDASAIAESVGISAGAVTAYIQGQNRFDLLERFNNSFGAALITRPWGRATKPTTVFVGGVL